MLYIAKLLLILLVVCYNKQHLMKTRRPIDYLTFYCTPYMCFVLCKLIDGQVRVD